MITPNQAEIKGANFIVGSFVNQLRQVGAQEFEFLETVVKGNILATAIFLPDPNRAVQKFKKTSIYFDTAVLIYAMGYAGAARQAPAKELVNLLHQSGAELRCFTHTLDEIRSILVACALRIESNNLRDSYGPSMEYFLANGYSGSDIRLFAGKVEASLEAMRVKVVDKPAFAHIAMIDEAKVSELIDKHVHHDNPNARIRDVASISAVMRLRGGRESLMIENSGALFVTTNAALYRAAKEFAFGENEADAVPPCLTDHALTNLL